LVLNKNILTIGIICLFILSVLSPIVFGFSVKESDKETYVEDYPSYRYMYPEYYDCYSVDEIPEYIEQSPMDEYQDYEKSVSQDIVNIEELVQPLGDPIDSPWPMYCHDTRHTGRSPYSTVDNTGFEKWRLYIKSGIEGGVIIGDNGLIYYGYGDFYTAYPNGTIKWSYNTEGTIKSSPAINEDGTIYVGMESASTKYFYAINPDGTLKWKHDLPGSVYSSSPAIGDDGTIYFGLECGYPWYGYIYALYPNGTLRWKYRTEHIVYSSPAIGGDGTVYCGSHDTYLYALYPNNGTLKWKYKTGNWIRVSPCIGDDGTIYVVSLDEYLHAVNPNGSLKWKTNMGKGGTSPTIGQDGTIYCGYTKLLAINPINGSLKWAFPVDGTIRGGTPCNSIDGTIYLGTSDGEDIFAINPDGTLRWKKYIGTCECAPAINEDGTVYIGTSGVNYGRLYAFGELDPNAPSAPTIDGETSGALGTEYEYTFKSTSPLGRDVFYYIEWGDNTVKDWFGPYNSGEDVTASHIWGTTGTYTIKARAKDSDNLWGPWGEFELTIKEKSRAIHSSLFLQFLDGFPLLQKVLLYLIK